MSLVQQLEQRARELGFERVGVAAATAADSFDRFAEWLDRGYAGEMDYLNRHREARRDPTSVLPEVRSVVMVAMSYNPGPQLSEQGVGRVTRFSFGERLPAGSVRVSFRSGTYDSEGVRPHS